MKEKLEKKYQTEFISDGMEKRNIDDFYVQPETLGHQLLIDGNDTTVYQFHPKDCEELHINVFYKEYYTYEVFPTKNEWYQDDFEMSVLSYALDGIVGYPFDSVHLTYKAYISEIEALKSRLKNLYEHYHLPYNEEEFYVLLKYHNGTNITEENINIMDHTKLERFYNFMTNKN